jgi:hypothetical protein
MNNCCSAVVPSERSISAFFLFTMAAKNSARAHELRLEISCLLTAALEIKTDDWTGEFKEESCTGCTMLQS